MIPTQTNPKRLREAKGLTIAELAALAGISVPTIKRAEKRGGWPVNASVRAAHKRALGVDETTRQVVTR